MLDGCTPYPEEFRERYRRQGYWRAETISQAVSRSAFAHPQRTAVADATRTLTYAQLLEEARSFREVLAKHGLRRGERIIIQLPNCVEFASLSLACFDLGVIPIMALPAFRRAELEYLAKLTAAKAIASAPDYRGFDHATLAVQLTNEIPSLESVFSIAPRPGTIDLHQAVPDSEPLGASQGDPFEVALFLLSGGTTGLPKLIPRTHADYLYNARETAMVCALGAGSRILIVLPTEHNFALACPGLLGALVAGAATVFSQDTRAADLAATISREQITHLPCVPTLAITLLDLPEPERRGLDSLRVITVGGQRLQQATAFRLKRAWPRLAVQQVLGMAEGLLCYTRLDDRDEVTCSTQGRPLSPADEIRIVDGSGREVVPGDCGELWCRGPYTIRGYYRATERNLEAFTADGFYRTGDLVRRDSSGNLVVVGRIKDQINRGGEKISAEEVEAHLIAHDAVSAAAVVAMPDELLGERACAFVTLRPGATLDLERMREFLAARGLARYKWPERLEVIDSMPLTHVGKVKKAELQREIEGRIDREYRRKGGSDSADTHNRA
jgi:2,3-dihydroxybenzoate---[aryl-carrier protein] ligase